MPSAPGWLVARVSTMKFVGAAFDVQRIVRLQRNEHRAAAALVDEVEAMIEELAEEGEPPVEWRGEPGIRRHVVDLEVFHKVGVGRPVRQNRG